MMNKHITILLLLSSAFIVLSAPAATSNAPRKQGRCKAGGGLKHSPLALSASPKSHAQSLHKRSPEFDDSPLEHLYRRASSGDIKLCNMNFRRRSVRNCRGSRGFINGVWRAAGTFSTTGLECDHILEL